MTTPTDPTSPKKSRPELAGKPRLQTCNCHRCGRFTRCRYQLPLAPMADDFGFFGCMGYCPCQDGTGCRRNTPSEAQQPTGTG